MAKSNFKLEHPPAKVPRVLEKRQAEAACIREKCLDRIPVVVERAERTTVPDTDKKTALISTIHEEYRDDDGLIYMTYSGENTFGLRIIHN